MKAFGIVLKPLKLKEVTKSVTIPVQLHAVNFIYEGREAHQGRMF